MFIVQAAVDHDRVGEFAIRGFEDRLVDGSFEFP